MISRCAVPRTTHHCRLALTVMVLRPLSFLKRTRNIVRRISGLHSSSLGLHPALYFYSRYGRYQPTAFLAIVSLVKDFEEGRLFSEFTRVRCQFEGFLLQHRTFANQVASKYGSGARGFERLKEIYSFSIDHFRKGETKARILKRLQDNDRFGVVTAAVKAEEAKPVKSFTTETKSAVFLRAALDHPLRCKLCNGLIHFNSITIDHIQRKEDGGLGVVDNGQLAHPYCNSTYKN